MAPAGSVLTITASPEAISSQGVSQIRVVARRSTGSPVAEGTPVFFSTTVGRVDPARAETDSAGVARASLFGAGEIGDATVTASSGAAADVSVVVAIGEAGSG